MRKAPAPDTASQIIPWDTDKTLPIRTDLENGYYINTYYPFLPGIILFLNEVHTTGINVGTFAKESELILLNYCISGRCEFKTGSDKYRYLTDNNLSISGYVVRESFFYPTDFYIGFEVGILEEMFTDRTYSILKEFNIDIDKLKRISQKDSGLLITEAAGDIQKLWLDMYGSPDDQALIKLDLLKILRILSISELGNNKDAVYLTKAQMSLARAVQARLTEDISVHVSMREISQELKVSESSLKNYFKIMFDMNVSEYMRILRMKKAAKMLTETELSVFDIADRCGYTNQGRFARIFKEYYGMRPLEYRHVGLKYKK
ncbi:MAG: AraC family transcriptional regulator [Lachnospiraceae bacterium]|nr:AraC family transcriptional regulator [Lachnospiraceae bacterium]